MEARKVEEPPEDAVATGECAGNCPSCARPVEWLPIDGHRSGRVCRACGWVELPETPVIRHTVGSLLRKVLPPHARLIPLIDYLEGLCRGRRARE